MTDMQESMRDSDSIPSHTPCPAFDAQSSQNGVRTVETIEGLTAIKGPDTELVIWQRDLATSFGDWIETVDAVNLPDLRILVTPQQLRPVLESLLDDCHMPPGTMRDVLITDVFELTHAFANITGRDLVDVRLERINHDACWKFHRDSVETRLLTTYRGATTEWIRPEFADQAEQEQRGFKGPLERLGLFDVAIFKGRDAGPNGGIVHRSPPIKGTRQTRLLLCLNIQSASSPEPWTELCQRET